MSSSSRQSTSSRNSSKCKIGGIFSKLKGKAGSLVKKVFRRKKTNEASGQKEEEDDGLSLLLEKWICVCYNSSLVADVAQQNVVFSPATTLCTYVALVLALSKEARQALKVLIVLSPREVDDFAARLRTVPPLDPAEAFFFLRLITDNQEDALVAENYLKTLSGYFGPYTIIRVDPAEVCHQLAGLTGNVLTTKQPQEGHTTGYCPASLRTHWDGETGQSRVEAPFLTSYYDKQSHKFFELTSVCNNVVTDDFEAWSLPISTESGRSFSLVLLRPHLVGCLLEMRKQLTDRELRKIFEALDEEEAEEELFLLPSCSVSVSEDIWGRWINNYPPFCTLEKASLMPPLACIWHTAVFSMSTRGVGYKYSKRLPVSSGPSTAVSPSRMQYSARLDSPFLFFVNVENHVTIVAGCYMGYPPPNSDAISMSIPEEILLKPPPRQPKKSKKSARGRRKGLRRQSKSRSFFSKMTKSAKRKISAISNSCSKSSKRKNKTSK